MDTTSFFLGLVLGLGVEGLVFLYVFYTYKMSMTEKHLKDFKELQEAIKALEVTPDGNKEE